MLDHQKYNTSSLIERQINSSEVWKLWELRNAINPMQNHFLDSETNCYQVEHIIKQMAGAFHILHEEWKFQVFSIPIMQQLKKVPTNCSFPRIKWRMKRSNLFQSQSCNNFHESKKEKKTQNQNLKKELQEKKKKRENEWHLEVVGGGVGMGGEMERDWRGGGEGWRRRKAGREHWSSYSMLLETEAIRSLFLNTMKREASNCGREAPRSNRLQFNQSG